MSLTINVTSGGDIGPAIAAGFANGPQEVRIPNGSFVSSVPIVIPAYGSLIGEGSGCTTITVQHTGHGVELNSQSRALGVSVNAAAKHPGANGALAHGRRQWLQDCAFNGFGQDGIEVHGGIANANLTRIVHCRVSANGRRGLYVHGNDGNVCRVDGLDVVGNAEWGIYAGGAKHLFEAVHCSTNGTGEFGGAIYDNAKSCIWIGPYVEAGQGDLVVFGPNNNYTVWFDTLYGATIPLVEGNGGAAATVLHQGRLFPHSIQSARKIGLSDSPGGPTWNLRVDASTGALSTVGPNTPTVWFPAPWVPPVLGPPPAPAHLTGGSITVYTDATGTWREHVFLTTETLRYVGDGTPVNAEAFVMAGAGPGGSGSGGSGGGGAGGVRTGNLSISSDQSIQIGAGGAAGAGVGANGTNSSIGALLVADGGGAGARYSNSTPPASNGGSGGGAARNSGNPGSGIPGQGFGGGGPVTGGTKGAGGGGASGPGTLSNGGPGIEWPPGSGNIYGRGGDGGGWSGNGAVNNSTPAPARTPGSGDGGGGGLTPVTGVAPPAHGASGRVIVRYPDLPGMPAL